MYNMAELKKITLLIVSLLLSGWMAKAQDSLPSPDMMRFNYKLDSTTIMIGDQTVLSIEKTKIYPSLEDLTNNDIIAVRQWIDTTDGTLYTALTSFEEGEHWLHIGADSVMLTVNDVSGVDTTTANIRDIANIMNQPYTFGEIVRALAFFWLFWAVVALTVLIWLRFKKKKPLISVPQAPPLPPDTRALQRLENLRQQQLWQQGLVKEYYTELTDTVRVYLEESYGIQSTEMTTDQTLDSFHNCPAYSDHNASTLSQILQNADMVKFAKSTPQPYQHDLSLNQAIEFIKNTAAMTPKEEPSDAENNVSPSPINTES